MKSLTLLLVVGISAQFDRPDRQDRLAGTCAAEDVAPFPVADGAALAGPACTFDRRDGTDAIFYVIEADAGFVDSIAKVSPLAASAMLNFVAYGGIAPPVDMARGQIGFARMPTRASVAAKAERDWPKVDATQRELPDGTGALVDYRSTRHESGEMRLVLSPSLVDAAGTRVEPPLPGIEVRLVATERPSLAVQDIPDRRAAVFAIAGYEVIARQRSGNPAAAR